MQQIANRVGCTKSAVISAMKRHRIAAKDRTPSSRFLRDHAWLTTMYASGLTTHHIAAYLGCSQASIYRAMCRFQIARRPLGCRPVASPKSGYRQGSPTRDGGSRLAHRQIMETHLGRTLTPEEHVHHIDGNKLNNDPTNLVVLMKSDHHKLHGNGAKQRMAGFEYLRYPHQCVVCDRSFMGGNRAKRCPGCRHIAP